MSSSPDTFGGGDGDSFAAATAAGDLKLTAVPVAAAGEDEPQKGWLVCNGAAVLRGKYVDLFNAIGDVYGAGDGVTTFNLPNYRDSFPLVAGAVHARGSRGGEDTHVLTVAELASHGHGSAPHGHGSAPHAHTASNDNHSHGYDRSQNGVAVQSGAGAVAAAFQSYGHVQTDVLGTLNIVVNPAAAVIDNAAAVIDNAGGGAAHNNLPPFQTCGGVLISY